ncbi:MAG: enoyl-ACP reductase, partial [Kiritimatiellaceae bacterium]|nr:enoyl-ACP reductase [Kiritimatiellaceae bacterium]
YQKEFLELFGFGLDGIDYSKDVEVDRPIQSLSS